MKTFTEAAQQAHRHREHLFATDREWIAAIEAADIAPYAVTEPAEVAPHHDSLRVRNLLRAHVRAHGAVRLGIACDNCKTELINREPGILIASNPPQIYVGCVGCGWRGNLVR